MKRIYILAFFILLPIFFVALFKNFNKRNESRVPNIPPKSQSHQNETGFSLKAVFLKEYKIAELEEVVYLLFDKKACLWRVSLANAEGREKVLLRATKTDSRSSKKCGLGQSMKLPTRYASSPDILDEGAVVHFSVYDESKKNNVEFFISPLSSGKKIHTITNNLSNVYYFGGSLNKKFSVYQQPPYLGGNVFIVDLAKNKKVNPNNISIFKNSNSIFMCSSFLFSVNPVYSKNKLRKKFDSLHALDTNKNFLEIKKAFIQGNDYNFNVSVGKHNNWIAAFGQYDEIVYLLDSKSMKVLKKYNSPFPKDFETRDELPMVLFDSTNRWMVAYSPYEVDVGLFEYNFTVVDMATQNTLLTMREKAQVFAYDPNYKLIAAYNLYEDTVRVYKIVKNKDRKSQ